MNKLVIDLCSGKEGFSQAFKDEAGVSLAIKQGAEEALASNHSSLFVDRLR
jgi:hypothetical protein